MNFNFRCLIMPLTLVLLAAFAASAQQIATPQMKQEADDFIKRKIGKMLSRLMKK